MCAIRLDNLQGNIGKVCTKLADIAQREGEKIIYEFNEIDMIAYPDDDAGEAVYQRYRFATLLSYVKEKYGYDPGD